jgi:hypothetical protein
LDKDILVFVDHPTGPPRYTYARLDGDVVTALVILAPVQPIDGVPCFQIGYAVPASHRNAGRAKAAIQSAIAELWNGVRRHGATAIAIEAIVAADNEASNRVAMATLSRSPKEITEQLSGLLALQYVKIITG